MDVPQPLFPSLGTHPTLAVPGCQFWGAAEAGGHVPGIEGAGHRERRVDCVCVLGEEKAGRTLCSRALFSGETSGQPIRAQASHAPKATPPGPGWGGGWGGHSGLVSILASDSVTSPFLLVSSLASKTLISRGLGGGVGGGTKEPLPGDQGGSSHNYRKAGPRNSHSSATWWLTLATPEQQRRRQEN